MEKATPHMVMDWAENELIGPFQTELDALTFINEMEKLGEGIDIDLSYISATKPESFRGDLELLQKQRLHLKSVLQYRP